MLYGIDHMYIGIVLLNISDKLDRAAFPVCPFYVTWHIALAIYGLLVRSDIQDEFIDPKLLKADPHIVYGLCRFRKLSLAERDDALIGLQGKAIVISLVKQPGLFTSKYDAAALKLVKKSQLRPGLGLYEGGLEDSNSAGNENTSSRLSILGLAAMVLFSEENTWNPIRYPRTPAAGTPQQRSRKAAQSMYLAMRFFVLSCSGIYAGLLSALKIGNR